MIRLTLTLTLGLALFATAAIAETGPYDRATVSDRYVSLGDLFRDTGDLADIVVARAPAPGKQVRYSAAQMGALARRYGLQWRPSARSHGTLVISVAAPVARAAVAKAVASAFGEEGLDQLQIDIANRDLPLYANPGTAPEIIVRNLNYDPASLRFAASIAIASDDNTASPVRIVGQAHRIVAIATLRRSVAAGDTVGPADVQLRNVRVQQVDRSMLTDIAAVIGKSARRSLREGTPLRARDLGDPVTISKGSLVNMTLASPGLVLTATGRALEDGTDGQLIRVMNEHSKRTVRGVVISANHVRVYPQQRIAGDAAHTAMR